MARIAGINLPNDKRIEAALQYVAGIGATTATKICADAGVDPNIRAKDLTEAQEQALRDEVAKVPTEGDLRRMVSQNVKTMQEIQCYRGLRHKKHLPVRGQKTKTNARTRKGKKKMAVAKKKMA